MTFNHYLPPKTMAFIVKLADEYCLSWKEVERILLNKVLFELGMTCEHKRRGHAKKDGKSFCKDCWTRFEYVKERAYSYDTKKWSNIEKYEPLDTFLEELGNKNLNVQGKEQIRAEDRDQYV
jgi:hypothetical protein